MEAQGNNNNQRDREARLAAIEQELGGDAFDHNWLLEEEAEPDPDMWVSDDEFGWARELKRQAEADGGITKPLTNMEYAEFAIFNGGNTANALKQVKGMQQLRELYNIQDTLEECVHSMQEFIRLQPGLFLHLDVFPVSRTPTWVVDIGAFNPAILMASEQNWKIYVLWEHYAGKAMMSSLRSCREGVYFMMDAHDMGWHNIDMNFEHRFFTEIVPCFPYKLKHFHVFNCNTMINLFLGLTKRIIPQKWKRVLRLGLSCDEIGFANKLMLSEIHLQPSFDVAMERLVQRVKRLLAQRYRNEEDFTL